MYIYDLPYLEQRECCNILDENNLWVELATVHMKFDEDTIKVIKRKSQSGKSPTEFLFTLWGNQNHTVIELFMLLKQMEKYNVMEILKKFVMPKYHILIKPVACSSKEIENVNSSRHTAPNVNLEQSVKILNVSRMDMNREVEISRENNESSVGEILNPKPRFQPVHYSRQTFSDISSVVESAGVIPQIPYEDLQRSTDNWNRFAILGKGGFGTVFKGTWKCTEVAIKRMEQKEDNPESHNEQMKQSITELRWLNACRHDNILPVYGYSIDGPQPCLVYQYMPGGCLEHRLRVRDIAKVLTWPVRQSIAIGSARGLQFLHTNTDKPLIHGDIKSANILLDRNDIPRIGDFGLAREGPQSNYTKISKIHGTRPYLPDEFLRGKKFSTKVDTYSFGVVLFEIATGLASYSEKRTNKFLRDHIVDYEGDIMELKDPRAAGGDVFCFRRLIDIGKLCVNRKAKDRPEMVEVFKALEKII
ncbi:hypothetical protein WA026_003901 [Henosepilachna vigintioctopunctata]|uniref:non-specific serine/threonine protein kinase n=1 Tax=Henosepilachna vigintioctopunctata TaxID=420089 RepID=A0AAW1UD78_9CUCU